MENDELLGAELNDLEEAEHNMQINSKNAIVVVANIENHITILVIDEERESEMRNNKVIHSVSRALFTSENAPNKHHNLYMGSPRLRIIPTLSPRPSTCGNNKTTTNRKKKSDTLSQKNDLMYSKKPSNKRV